MGITNKDNYIKGFFLTKNKAPFFKFIHSHYITNTCEDTDSSAHKTHFMSICMQYQSMIGDLKLIINIIYWLCDSIYYLNLIKNFVLTIQLNVLWVDRVHMVRVG